MAEKLGNGGHGPEEYSQKDGKYVADGEINSDGKLSPSDKKVIQTEIVNQDFEIADLDELDELEGLDDLDDFLDGLGNDENDSTEEIEESDFISNTLLKRINNAGQKYELLKQSAPIEDYVDIESVTDENDMIQTLINKYHLNKKKLEKLDGEQLSKVFKSLYLIAYKQYLRFEKNNENNSYNMKMEYASDYEDLDVKEEEALIGELMSKNGVYSDFAKNTAVWITGNNKNEKTNDLVKGYTNYFWDNFSFEEREDIIGYTQSYSWINEPLYNAKYTGKNYGKQPKDFVNAVQNITNAINKSSYPFNMWIQRYSSDSNYFTGPNGGKVRLGDLTNEQLENLVGTSFVAENFFSTGGAKGTGYGQDKALRFNIYCPKGTKMLYVAKHSHFAYENEILLQRGYSYKITSIKKEPGGIYYLDLEIDLNSIDNLDNSEKFLRKKWNNSVGED